MVEEGGGGTPFTLSLQVPEVIVDHLGRDDFYFLAILCEIQLENEAKHSYACILRGMLRYTAVLVFEQPVSSAKICYCEQTIGANRYCYSPFCTNIIVE